MDPLLAKLSSLDVDIDIHDNNRDGTATRHKQASTVQD
jgi:hypothetical protein